MPEEKMPTKNLTFGQALTHLKEGRKVTRFGWSDQNIWVYLVPGSTFQVAAGRPLAAHLPVGEEVTYKSHIDMKAADGTHFAWSPNNLDLLAEDWEVID